MSGCLNSGADGSWHVRQTTNPVITPYTQIAKANSAIATHGVSRIRGEYRQPGCSDARQFPAATGAVTQPDPAVTPHQPGGRHRQTEPRQRSGDPKSRVREGRRMQSRTHDGASRDKCEQLQRHIEIVEVGTQPHDRRNHQGRQQDRRDTGQYVADDVIAVIGCGYRHDAGRHHRRERIRFHGAMWSSADITTGRFSGSAATPIAVRACRPCSPNTSSRRSEAGLSTGVVCG